MKYNSQAAVDFLTAYGIALLVVTIAIAIIIKVSFLSPVLSTSTCTPSAGFSCEFYSINTSGVLTITLAQATGATLTIHGIACSSLLNTSGDLPMYGNIFVTPNLAYYPPKGQLGSGVEMFSDTSHTFYVNCYTAHGLAKSSIGDTFIGYLWINYSMPGYGQTIQEIASLNLKYT